MTASDLMPGFNARAGREKERMNYDEAFAKTDWNDPVCFAAAAAMAEMQEADRREAEARRGKKGKKNEARKSR